MQMQAAAHAQAQAALQASLPHIAGPAHNGGSNHSTLPHISLLAPQSYTTPSIVSPYLATPFNPRSTSPPRVHNHNSHPSQSSFHQFRQNGKKILRPTFHPKGTGSGHVIRQRSIPMQDKPSLSQQIRRLPSYMGETANRRHKLGPNSNVHQGNSPHDDSKDSPSPSPHSGPHLLSHHTGVRVIGGSGARKMIHTPPFDNNTATRSLNTSPLPPPPIKQQHHHQQQQPSDQSLHQSHPPPKSPISPIGPSTKMTNNYTTTPSSNTSDQLSNSSASASSHSPSPISVSVSAVDDLSTTTSTSSPPIVTVLTPTASTSILTTTTTTTTTSTVSTPLQLDTPPVVSNTIPDLLFLLSPNEHHLLMTLLRGRIDGKSSDKTLLVASESQKNLRPLNVVTGTGGEASPQSLITSPIVGSLSPTSGSLRRPSFNGTLLTATHLSIGPNANGVGAGGAAGPPGSTMSLNGVDGTTPASPSARVLHFQIPSVSASGDGASTTAVSATSPTNARQLDGSPVTSPLLGPAAAAAAAHQRARSKSFSAARNSLPRRPSLMSVREEGGLLNPSTTIGGSNSSQPIMSTIVPGVHLQQEELLRQAIAGTGHGQLGARSSSLIVRPLGGGGLIPLPPNWSRQGSNTPSSHGQSDVDDTDDDDESHHPDAPIPPVIVLANEDAAQIVAGSPNMRRRGSVESVQPLRLGQPSLGRSHSATAAERSILNHAHAPLEAAKTERQSILVPANHAMRSHSAIGGGASSGLSGLVAGGGSSSDDHHNLLPPGQGRRHPHHRFTMGANFAAALQSALLPPPPLTVATQATAVAPGMRSSEVSSVRFDPETEENSGTFWSLSHATLLLERVALEKGALSPMLSDYVTQALEYIHTAKDIIKGRMSRLLEVHEKLKSHPEHVSEWLQEFAGGKPDQEDEIDGPLSISTPTTANTTRPPTGTGSKDPSLTLSPLIVGGGLGGDGPGTTSSRRATARRTMSSSFIVKQQQAMAAAKENLQSKRSSISSNSSNSLPMTPPTHGKHGSTDAAANEQKEVMPMANGSYHELQTILLQDPILLILHNVSHARERVRERDDLL